MNLVKKISFNNLHIYFFYLFLFSIPLQTRKVFLTQYSFYGGAFTEYATFFIYASDISLILTLIFWLVFNKKLYKYLNIENLKNARKLPAVFLLLLAFIVWLIISAVINNNYAEISAFYILKFIELSLLVIYIYFNLRNKNRLITTLFIISLSGFLQGLIAIYQFIYQCPLFKSPILHRLTGESTVYPQLPGIAKIVINNEKLIRSYGTFPHPNILGGFLILTMILTIYLFLKHKRDILSSINIKFNLFYNINDIKSQGYISSVFWIILIFTQITALFFTFSRTAWFGFLLSLFVMSILYFYNHKIVSRETIGKIYFAFVKTIRKILFIKTYWIPASAGITKSKEVLNKLENKLNNKKNIRNAISKHKELFIVFLLTTLLIISYFPALKSRLSDNLINKNSYLLNNSALSDRSFYNNVSRETISENFVFGSGPGTFIFQINDYLAKNKVYQELEPWQYQPAHNIYLLIASEIGIIGLLLFLLFVFYVISNSFKNTKSTLYGNSIVSRETILGIKKLNYYLLAILISFLFIGLFDHYFWTLQQGRLIFWLVLGLILASGKIASNENKY
jgi:hypothetical protein